VILIFSESGEHRRSGLTATGLPRREVVESITDEASGITLCELLEALTNNVPLNRRISAL